MTKSEKIDSWVFLPAMSSCALAFAWLAYSSHQVGGVSVAVFTAIAFYCAACAAGVVAFCWRTGQSVPLIWIIGSALVFRGFGVFGYPLFEDDFFRYLWDGFRTAESLDPYSLAPANFFGLDDVPEQFDDILSGINYPDVATVYGPVCQWLFAAAYWVSPASIWPLQLIMASADMLVLLLLCTMTRSSALLLYAWSPLLVKEFAITAHPDIAAIALSVFAVWAYQRSWFAVVGVALGLALGVKVFAILLLPFLLFKNRVIKESLATIVALIVTVSLITWVYGTPRIWYPEGLQAMAESWFFNAPVFYLLNQWVTFASAKIIMASIFLLVSGVWVFRVWFIRLRQPEQPDNDQRWIPRGDILFGLFLICLPVLNPWYLPWVLPFAVIFPSRWAWVASSSILLAYWSGLYTGDSSLELHEISSTVLLVEFGVIAAMLLWDYLQPLVANNSKKTNNE